MKKFLFVAFCLGAVAIHAQSIVIDEPPGVGVLMQKFVEGNRARTEVDGWRIQLLATTDRQRVENEKTRFQSLYPGVFIDWVHTRPYYKLRAGAYGTRLETYRFLYTLKREYPGAYPAIDKVRVEELVN